MQAKRLCRRRILTPRSLIERILASLYAEKGVTRGIHVELPKRWVGQIHVKPRYIFFGMRRSRRARFTCVSTKNGESMI